MHTVNAKNFPIVRNVGKTTMIEAYIAGNSINLHKLESSATIKNPRRRAESCAPPRSVERKIYAKLCIEHQL